MLGACSRAESRRLVWRLGLPISATAGLWADQAPSRGAQAPAAPPPPDGARPASSVAKPGGLPCRQRPAAPNPTPHPRPAPSRLLTKPWSEAAGYAAAPRAAAFTAAARGGGGGSGAAESIFCTNVSGLKGNSPMLIGLMEYFSVGAGVECVMGQALLVVRCVPCGSLGAAPLPADPAAPHRRLRTLPLCPQLQRHMPRVGFYQPIGADVLTHGKGAKLPKHVAM